jgi:hypothetical protein
MKSELAIRYSVLEKYKFKQIADDYAIYFVEWLFNIDKEVLKKQLNEFKKEKGL